ncbi:MAG: hypothetical protein R3274_06655 [Desulfobacterales bacterium]|nr:hypothetical protein [Desulfobacterales bacterium]
MTLLITIEPDGVFNGRCAMKMKSDAIKKPLSETPVSTGSKLSKDP